MRTALLLLSLLAFSTALASDVVTNQYWSAAESSPQAPPSAAGAGLAVSINASPGVFSTAPNAVCTHARVSVTSNSLPDAGADIFLGDGVAAAYRSELDGGYSRWPGGDCSMASCSDGGNGSTNESLLAGGASCSCEVALTTHDTTDHVYWALSGVQTLNGLGNSLDGGNNGGITTALVQASCMPTSLGSINPQ